jgi:hypothetical protein
MLRRAHFAAAIRSLRRLGFRQAEANHAKTAGPSPAVDLGQDSASRELLPSAHGDHDGQSTTCQYERRRLGHDRRRGDNPEIIVDVRRKKDVANDEEGHRTRRR